MNERRSSQLLAEKYQVIQENIEKPTLKVGSNGTKTWYQNGVRHRLDGPAVEYSDGNKMWYQNGMRHRLDGPAVEYSSGNKAWYQNGKLHRLDGPAVEYSSGSNKMWYINGIEYNEKEFDLKKRTRELLKKASDETGIEMDI